MATDTRQVVTLFMFFVAVALCMWRWPQADRWHVVLCVVVAALWCGVLWFEPRTRTTGFGFIVVALLTIGLRRPFQRRLNMQR